MSTRKRFDVRTAILPTEFPAEAILAELCATKDATEKMLTEFTLLRGNVTDLLSGLKDIADSIKENSQCVGQAIEHMDKSMDKMEDLEQRGDNITATTDRLEGMIKEAKVAVDSLRDSIDAQ